MTSTNLSITKISGFMPSWPLVIWLMAISLIVGLINGFGAGELIQIFNKGWGLALGEFALILVPSFTLSAVLSRKSVGSASLIATLTSPLAGAGMICPDTAYAALSPVAGRRRLSVAMGAYSGFKLLFPAGPLIVATGLGINDPSLLIVGILFLGPVWGVGILWANAMHQQVKSDTALASDNARGANILMALLPFGILLGLLLLGWVIDFSKITVLDFVTTPKGALILSAGFALLSLPSGDRRACLDEAVRRSASLLFVIGAASAFGAILTTSFDVSHYIPAQSGIMGIIGLFTLTAIFKLMQGSSMATFAAVAPVAAPIVAASGLSPIAAVFAICLGSFVAILPNDSFYWLVRKDALPTQTDGECVKILAGGATAQAIVGLLLLLILSTSGVV